MIICEFIFGGQLFCSLVSVFFVDFQSVLAVCCLFDRAVSHLVFMKSTCLCWRLAKARDGLWGPQEAWTEGKGDCNWCRAAML